MNKTLKKSFKIAGITLGSILGLLIIVLALACWMVFSPSKLTKVAGKAIDKYSPARAEVDTVDLTLVGTYPFLGFRLNGLVIYDDMEDSPSDTLASLDKLTVTVDFKSLYKEKKIILTNLFIDGVKANVFRASDGRPIWTFSAARRRRNPLPMMKEWTSTLTCRRFLSTISMHHTRI